MATTYSATFDRPHTTNTTHTGHYQYEHAGSNDVREGDGVNHAPMVKLVGSNFRANAHAILSDVPLNITTYCSKHSSGSFIGFDSLEASSRHVVPIGKLSGIRFTSIFRFKVWWATHWVGSKGRDLEHETQMVMLENSDSGRPYVLILPLLEGPFRASIQPGKDDFVDVCVESGSTQVCDTSFRSVIYIQAGFDPFILVKKAMKVIREHLGTFRLLEEKTPPGIVNKFGWCTWDAFYLRVHPEGVMEGVKGLVEGGCPPGLVIIDDGWQSVSHDDDLIDSEGINTTADTCEQISMACRLAKFIENCKFRDYQSSGLEGPKNGLGAFVRDLKKEFKSVDYVYVWQALCGYWCGIRPSIPGLPESSIVKPILSPGLEKTMEDLAFDKIVNNGVGLVPPEKVDQLFEGLYSHLESAGIDGVKVDYIHVSRFVVWGFGGFKDTRFRFRSGNRPDPLIKISRLMNLAVFIEGFCIKKRESFGSKTKALTEFCVKKRESFGSTGLLVFSGLFR